MQKAPLVHQGDGHLSKIKAVTNDNKLIITARPSITSGGKNVDELLVVFDKSWEFDSALYFVNFYLDNDSDGIVRRFEVTGNTGRCKIPDYITKEEGFFHFGVFTKADNDIIKTSDVVAYEVKKGICVEPEGDGDRYIKTLELKRWFIDLLNANVTPSSFYYSMRLGDIDATFSTYMSSLYGEITNLGGFSDGLYALVKEYVNPNLQKESETAMVFLSCIVALEDYFKLIYSRIDYDSDNSELIDLQNFKSEIRGIVRDYQGDDFDENSTDIDCLNEVREIVNRTNDLEKENNAFIDGLKELYMKEENNA